jgi:RHS repeat-associated protein
VVAIDATGQVTTYAYDERDSLKEVDQSPSAWTDPAATPNPKIVTAYAYDHAGNLTTVTRAQGDAQNERSTGYLYDGLNRLRQEVQYPAWPATTPTLVTGYTYDATSNRATVVDPLGRTTTLGYDPLNRLTSVSYSDGTTPNVAYAYDANGTRTSMADGTGTTTYASDELGRPTAVTGPGSVVVGYRYDLDGDRTKLVYPDGTGVTYSFNKGGQLASLSDWATPARTTSYAYAPDGHLTTATNPNGTTTTQSYDNARRLTQVLNQQGASTLSRHAYTLDAVGNRTQVTETLAQVGGGTTTPTTTYAYDKLYRLTGDGTRTYGYDPVGNRTSSSGTGATYDRADRVQSVGAASYTVDANGNLTARGADSFAYDQANRLKTATVGGSTTTYAWDGDGKRASATTGGTTTNYVYDANRSLPVVLSDGARKYVWGLGLAYAVDGAGAISVGHTDGLGSVRALTDGAGALTQTYLTDPFGAVLATGGSSAQPFRFTGEQRDDTGLYYLRARVYDPVLGRFLSRDPVFGSIADPLSLNRYSYVHNNPINGVDPSGHCLAKITRDDCPEGDDDFSDLTPTSCSDNTSITYFACGDPHAVAVPAGGPAILGPIDPISRIASAFDGGGGGGGGNKRPETVGNNLSDVRTIGSGRLRGYLRGNTELSGGVSRAKETFASLVGREPIGVFDRVVQEGREVVFRAESKSGVSKIEIIDHGQRFLEKISFIK